MQEFSVISEWRSRTSTLRRLRDPQGRLGDRVLKTCDAWTADHARASLANASLLAAVGGARCTVVTVHGHEVDPPALLMDYVEGEDLNDLLHSSASEERVESAIEAVAELLARWHRATAVPRRLHSVVQSAGDVGIYNFRVEGDGHVVYLEPPAWTRHVGAERDLAWFLDSLAVHQLGRRLNRSLRRAFLTAYAASAGLRGVRPVDRLVLEIELARRRRGRRRDLAERRTRSQRT